MGILKQLVAFLSYLCYKVNEEHIFKGDKFAGSYATSGLILLPGVLCALSNHLNHHTASVRRFVHMNGIRLLFDILCLHVDLFSMFATLSCLASCASVPECTPWVLSEGVYEFMLVIVNLGV
jgi:hypothetical protein